MTPPGLGLAAVSEAALAAEPASSPRFYFDWERTREGAGQSSTRRSRRRSRSSPGSTSRSGSCSRRVSRPRSTATSASAAPAAPASRRWASSSSRPTRTASAVVTAVRAPEGIDSGELVRGAPRPLRDHARARPGRARRARSSASATSAGSTSSTSRPRSRRVELVLAELGADVERGAAVTAALEAFEQQPSRDVTANASSSARRSPRPASTSCARRFDVDVDADERRSPRSSAATTRSSSARRRS